MQPQQANQNTSFQNLTFNYNNIRKDKQTPSYSGFALLSNNQININGSSFNKLVKEEPKFTFNPIQSSQNENFNSLNINLRQSNVSNKEMGKDSSESEKDKKEQVFNEKVIQPKRHYLQQLINELKKHYYIDEFFIDPEKQFIKLLEKLINFFEEDDLLDHLRQNEELYETFRKKYEETIQFIRDMDTKLPLITKINSPSNKKRTLKKHQSTIESNKKFICFDGKKPAEFTFNSFNIKTHESSEINKPAYNTNNQELKLALKSHSDDENIDLIEIYKRDLDKLKEDYFILHGEKKNLEEQIINQESIRLQLKNLSDENYNLKISLTENKERNERNKFELLDFQRRLKFLDTENQRLKQNNLLMKNAIDFSEKEKGNLKSKLNEQVLKSKGLDKEIQKHKKRISSLNESISQLTEKLDTEYEEKILLEEKNEELREENEELRSNLKSLTVNINSTICSDDNAIKDILFRLVDNNKLLFEFHDNEKKKNLGIVLNGEPYPFINIDNITFISSSNERSSEKKNLVIPKLKFDKLDSRRKMIHTYSKSLRGKNPSLSINISCIPEEGGKALLSNRFNDLPTNLNETLKFNQPEENIYGNLYTQRVDIDNEGGQTLNLLYSNKSNYSENSEEDCSSRNRNKDEYEDNKPKVTIEEITCESLNKMNKTNMKLQEYSSSKHETENDQDQEAKRLLETAISRTNIKAKFTLSSNKKDQDNNLKRMLSFVEDDKIQQKDLIDHSYQLNLGKPAIDLLMKFNVDNLKINQNESIAIEQLKHSKWKEIISYLDEVSMYIPLEDNDLTYISNTNNALNTSNAYRLYKSINFVNNEDEKVNSSAIFKPYKSLIFNNDGKVRKIIQLEYFFQSLRMLNSQNNNN